MLEGSSLSPIVIHCRDRSSSESLRRPHLHRQCRTIHRIVHGKLQSKYLPIFVDHHTAFVGVYFKKTKRLADSIPVRERFTADHAIEGLAKCFLSDLAQELMGITMKMQKAMHNHECGVTHTVLEESD